ncbi:hypothetical protein KSF_044660 [Reticulibacter mediterranei]|uniref:Uncharacterized protein n=1 Tax=Reticulibacter mediterranei TaxID=2778369 RepID=A0A8J3N3J2_9CHLR|nr:hypothetical protein [Reticulibacter mediterranei]GHO94418.1 hypothetical protein KSF_044660 [Reticulibacter mediterranei]
MNYIADIPNSLFHAATRNQLAERTISLHAAGRTMADIVISMLAPDGDREAKLASIASQVALVYRPMLKELVAIYITPPDHFARGMVTQSTIMGSPLNRTGEVVYEYLAGEFDHPFLLELLHEIWHDAGVEATSGVLLGIEATIAATLTWQVGVTIALYFLYGEAWIGAKQQTAEQARVLTGLPSPEMQERVNLTSIFQHVPQVREKALTALAQRIYQMKKATHSIGKDTMLSIFREEGIPYDLIEEALSRNR